MNKKELLDEKIKVMKDFLDNDGDIKKIESVQDNITPIGQNNDERMSVNSGEFVYYDDNGNKLDDNEVKSFLEDKKRQIIEKNKNRNINFITSNNIVKIRNLDDLLYIVGRNLNPNGDYLYDYCGIKYNSDDKQTKYYFDHEDIERVFVKKSESRKR